MVRMAGAAIDLGSNPALSGDAPSPHQNSKYGRPSGFDAKEPSGLDNN